MPDKTSCHRVYQFGLRPPVEGEHLIRASFRAAHVYRNNLIAIERGRRHTLRAIDDTPAVREAIDVVRTAPRSARRAAIAVLQDARRAARENRAEDLARIAALDKDACKGAYALAECVWGSKLDVTAAHQQSRSAPLYGDDVITPRDPHFLRHTPPPFPPDDPRALWWAQPAQLTVQLQHGVPTADILRGDNSRVRLVLGENCHPRRYRRYGFLWIRAGSEGRAPIWAKFPIKLHRAIPDAARWTWVRVSLHVEATREFWSVEITVDDPAPQPHTRDAALKGAIAVEWEWSMRPDGGIRVARWADTAGESGEVVLAERIAAGIRKPDGIRSVRDTILHDTLPRVARAIRETPDTVAGECPVCGTGEGWACLGVDGMHAGRPIIRMPLWLREAGNTMHLWKSPARVRALRWRWMREKCDAARGAYDILDAWTTREMHLYDYECGARGQALRRRRDFYRCLAAGWARKYKTVLLSDQDLSREAKFGAKSDVRFTAAIYEMRGALRNAFGEADAVEVRWKIPGNDLVSLHRLSNDFVDEKILWSTRVRDLWAAGGTRGDGIFAALKEKTGNAWAARKAKKKQGGASDAAT